MKKDKTVSKKSSLRLKREYKIEKTIINSGLKTEDGFILSFWDLAGDINNTWGAGKFFGDHHRDRHCQGHFSTWALPSWRLYSYRKPILNTINNMDDVEIIQKSPLYFKLKND